MPSTPPNPIESELLEIRRKEELINQVFDSDLYNLGADFFNKIVLRIAKVLQADFAFIGELTDDRKIHTVSMVAAGNLAENITYSLSNTPCEVVVGESICSFEREVAQQFPKDQLLQNMQVEGYVGAPLFDSDKKPTGILVALYQRPLEEEQLIRSVFHLFAARIGAEIEHMKIKQVLEYQNRELKIAKEKAEESDRLKSAFLDTISHEIRTPMNAMLGLSAALKQGIEDEQERTTFHNLIQQEGNHLLTLLDNILEFSVSEASHASRTAEPISRDQLEERATIALESAVINGAHPNLAFSVKIKTWEPDTHIQIEIDRVLKVLQELFSNAVKFTNQGSIQCHIQVTNRQLNCSVIDTGIGIPGKAAHSIFERFNQAPQENAPNGGSRGLGLGLSVCEKWVKILGGTIWAEPQFPEKNGTTISFSIPLDQ